MATVFLMGSLHTCQITSVESLVTVAVGTHGFSMSWNRVDCQIMLVSHPALEQLSVLV